MDESRSMKQTWVVVVGEGLGGACQLLLPEPATTSYSRGITYTDVHIYLLASSSQIHR
jgi:hypothetical protein